MNPVALKAQRPIAWPAISCHLSNGCAHADSVPASWATDWPRPSGWSAFWARSSPHRAAPYQYSSYSQERKHASSNSALPSSMWSSLHFADFLRAVAGSWLQIVDVFAFANRKMASFETIESLQGCRRNSMSFAVFQQRQPDRMALAAGRSFCPSSCSWVALDANMSKRLGRPSSCGRSEISIVGLREIGLLDQQLSQSLDEWHRFSPISAKSHHPES